MVHRQIVWIGQPRIRSGSHVVRPGQVSFSLPEFGLSSYPRQIEQLKRCELVPESVVKEVCSRAKELLMEEANVQYVDSPVTVSYRVCWVRRGLTL